MSDKDFKLNKTDTDAIRQLADVMDEKNLTELEFERGETSVRLAKYPVQAAPMPQNAAPVPPAVETSSAPANTLNAPMVGTFYHAPNPDAEPFVKAGDTVKQGQIIGVIEAMKTMNQVEADKSGTITEILVEDGHPVAFGDALMALK